MGAKGVEDEKKKKDCVKGGESKKVHPIGTKLTTYTTGNSN